jgi:hypothetical protein
MSPSACANCLDSFQSVASAEQSKFLVRISTGVRTRTKTKSENEGTDSDTDEDETKSVTILEALKLIFGITFPTPIETQTDDEDPLDPEELLVLCCKCTHYLSRLYSLYCEFRDLCHEDSYINTHKIEGGLDSKDTSENNRQEEVARNLVNKNPETSKRCWCW